MIVLGLVISVRVRGYRVGIRIRVRVRVRNAQDTKCLGTKKRGYDREGIIRNVWKPYIQCQDSPVSYAQCRCSGGATPGRARSNDLDGRSTVLANDLDLRFALLR